MLDTTAKSFFINLGFLFCLCSSTLFGQHPAATTDSIYSKTLDETRKFWVKLPDNYNPNSSTKYPVVFLLDGFALKQSLEAVYDNYWGHYHPRMILVGIANQSNRTRDLTTSQIKMRRGSPMDSETGGAEQFSQFITQELLPHIDKKYPTTPYRTLIGHSYGGLFTINMLLNHSEFFNNYIAIDPSLEWDNQQLLKLAKEKFKSKKFKGKGLFVSLAAEQLHMYDESITMDNVMDDKSEFTLFARSIIEFSNLAENNSDLNFAWKVYPEDLHGTVPLPSIRDGLVTLFKWYQFKSPQAYNNPETKVETIKQLLEKQAAIYSKNFGYPCPPMVEEMLTGYGYMNLHTGNPKKALLFFELGIKYYPNSANAYDSLADYYEAHEDYKNALKYVTKAFEISKSDYHKKRMETFKQKK